MTSPTVRLDPDARVVGVDTHKDLHVAVAVDGLGRRLGTTHVPTTAAGLQALLDWADSLGPVAVWGVEGTGSYGAALARLLASAGYTVAEVTRPDRRLRRSRGKSDSIDAEAAARAVLAGEALGTPKSGTGVAESLRHLRTVRRSALKARTQAANQLHALLLTAPTDLRAHLAHGSLADQVDRCARLRPGPAGQPRQACKLALRSVARRWAQLTEEIHELDQTIAPIVARAAAPLLARPGVGPAVASTLIITAGDNPDRLRNDRSFAALCGVSPLPASSGNTHRHRLNRGGDRQANAALYTVALCRMQHDPRTREYVARRTKEGLGKKEIIRCLKRYIARELYPLLLLTDGLDKT